MDLARAADVRADRRDRQFLFLAQWFPKIGVLEDTGWNCHQFHARRSSSPTSAPTTCASPCRADGSSAPPARARSHATKPTARRRITIYEEDVHDFAWTTSPDFVERRAGSSIRRCRPSRYGCCCSRSTTAGRPSFRGRARRAEVLRRVVRSLSLWTHHDRRSRVAKRRGRHGVPDAVHRGHALAHARHTEIPKTSPCTRPVISSGTASSRPTSSKHAWMDEGINTFATARVIERAVRADLLDPTVLRRVCPVGVPRLSAQPRDSTTIGCDVSVRREGRCALDAELALLAGQLPERSPTTRRRCGCTRSSACSDGSAAADSLNLLPALAVQASEARRTSSTSQRGQRP